MTDWADLTKRTLDGLESCASVYRPTNFWGPGLEQLLDDLDTRSLDEFKSWPSARWWFYPTYGARFTGEEIDRIVEYARTFRPGLRTVWLENALSGTMEARRDLDVARIAWDRKRWPFNVEQFGEDLVGQPPQYYRLTDHEKGWTKPYLNYLVCLAALSRHVDTPPTSFLEIGGGYGVLGEILLARDPLVRYVDLDIPPLITVASYYLRTLFGDRVTIYDRDVEGRAEVGVEQSAVQPNWRIDEVRGRFDVFVNSFSFQEMEPHVVEHYVDRVVEKKVEYVVSLNSRKGKPKAGDGNEIGVIEPVTSALIVAIFEARGYVLKGRYNRPFLHSGGEIAVLRRSGRRRRR